MLFLKNSFPLYYIQYIFRFWLNYLDDWWPLKSKVMQFYVSICMKSLDTLENGKHLKVKIASKYPQLKCFIFSVFLSLVNQSKTIAATSFFAKKVKKKKSDWKATCFICSEINDTDAIGFCFFFLLSLQWKVMLNWIYLFGVNRIFPFKRNYYL